MRLIDDNGEMRFFGQPMVMARKSGRCDLRVMSARPNKNCGVEITSRFRSSCEEAALFTVFCGEHNSDGLFGGDEWEVFAGPGAVVVHELWGDDISLDDFVQDDTGDWNEFAVVEPDQHSVVVVDRSCFGDCVGE